MYTLETDTANRCLKLQVTGFQKVEAIQQMVADMSVALSELRRHTQSFDLLVDLSDASPAEREAAPHFEAITHELRSLGLRKAAIIYKQGLAFLQARRVVQHDPRFQTFESKEAALAWFAQAAPGAPSALQSGAKG